MVRNQSIASSEINKHAWVILVVVYFAGVVAPFNQFKVPPIMPLLMAGFHLDLTQAGVLMSMMAAIGLILAIPASIVLRRLGPKKTIMVALGFLASGSLFGALAANFAWLLGSRILEGVGLGLIGVAAPATISMWFPPEKRGTPMGIWATWVPVGTVVVYNLAPALSSSLNWQAVWWVGNGFALIMMILAGLLITQPPDLAANELQGQPSTNLRKTLSNRNIWFLALSFTCMNLVMVSINTYYPTFLKEYRGFTLGQAASIASIMTFLKLVSSPSAGWLSDRLGSRRMLFSIPFLLIAILLLFPFKVTGWWILLVMSMIGLFMGVIPAATFAAAPDIMENPQFAGLGMAVVLIGQNVGQLIGPILFGRLVQNIGWSTAGYMIIPVCILGFASGWMVKVR
ncbi:MAG: MFS transporter [Anaerolineae bacterium]|nr:MFS transporter [Anaerolineae bacterium]